MSKCCLLSCLRGNNQGPRRTLLDSISGEIELDCPRFRAHVKHHQNRIATARVLAQKREYERIFTIQWQGTPISQSLLTPPQSDQPLGDRKTWSGVPLIGPPIVVCRTARHWLPSGA